MRALFTVMLIVAVAAVPSRAQEKDHPMLKAYAGSTINTKEVKDFDEQIMLLSVIAPSKSYKSEKLEGKVTRINYGDPNGRSTLEKFANYATALKGAGFEILWQCVGYEPCGPQVNIPGIGQFPYSEQGRNLTARLRRAEGDVWIGVQVKPAWTDVQIVEAKPMETGMVTVSADALTKGIIAEGHVAVYGIYFETGSAALRAESASALKEIATMLQRTPALKLYVVGHTDNVGAMAANVSLSRRRAGSVVTALTTTHKIDSARLQADGVGSLAPVASNDNDGGRARNRRVELVKQ